MVSINAPAYSQSHAFNFSLALVEAMGAAGLTMATVQPTAQMLEAGAHAANISPKEALRVYLAMIKPEG